MAKIAVEKEIHSRKIKTPNAIYNILGTVWRLFMYKQYNVHYTFKKDFRKEEGPYFWVRYNPGSKSLQESVIFLFTKGISVEFTVENLFLLILI